MRLPPHPHDLPLLEGPEELDLQGGALAERHAGQGLLGPADGLRLPYHVGKAVLGVVPLVIERAPQLALPGLHVVEPPEQGEGPDAGALPDDRHHLLGVPLESLPLQQGLQPQAEGDFNHHAGGTHPLAQVDDGLHARRDAAALVRGHGNLNVRRLRRAGVEGNPVDVGDAELLQLGDGLPG